MDPEMRTYYAFSQDTVFCPNYILETCTKLRTSEMRTPH